MTDGDATWLDFAVGVQEAEAAMLPAIQRPDAARWLAVNALRAATPVILAAAFADAADNITDMGYPDIGWVLDSMSLQIRQAAERQEK